MLHVTETHAVQAISRNEVIAHEIGKQAERPEVGEKIKVEYKEGQDKAKITVIERNGPGMGR